MSTPAPPPPPPTGGTPPPPPPPPPPAVAAAPPPPPPPPPGAEPRQAPGATASSIGATGAPSAATGPAPSTPPPANGSVATAQPLAATASPAPASPAPASPASTSTDTPPSRTTSTDLTDLLGQLGDGTDGHVPDPRAPLTDPRDLERPGDAAAVVVESTGAINFNPEFASFGARAGGWAIDTLITTLALLPGVALLFGGSGIVRLLGVVLIVVGFGLVAWSYTVAVARNGQWVGNRITSTTVVNVSNGEFIDQPHAFTRFLVRAVFSPILFAGFALALTNTDRRTFHDQAADSIVTRPSRASWSIGDEAA